MPILNLYIEITNDVQSFKRLENLLRTNNYPFYDATEFDSFCTGPNASGDLLDIEAQIEGK
jgi:hypothetical protein